MLCPPLINTNSSVNQKPNIVLVVPQNIPNIYDDILKGLDDCNIQKVPDIRLEIEKNLSSANALIGCPRAIFDDDIVSLTNGNLKWVHNPGAGVEHLLVDSLINSNIVFTNGKIIQGPECADHALGLLLSLTRNIAPIAKKIESSLLSRPIELLGKKALVIGLGGIGMAVAERLNAFGVKVSGIEDDYVPMLSFLNEVRLIEELDSFIGKFDIVVMAAPHTFKTNKIIDKELIRKFKRGSYFINVSRGATVDIDSLVFGIKEGILAGIGIDVTDPEPLDENHELRSFHQVMVTNHIAGLSEFNRQRSANLIRKNIIRFSRGENLLNIVNKKSGY